MQMLNGLRQTFEDNQAVQQSMPEDRLSLSEAAIYEDKRAHFVFSDKSGMILHPNGDCFTLFSKNG